MNDDNPLDFLVFILAVAVLLLALVVLLPSPTCQPGRHIVAFPHGGLTCVEYVR